LIELQADLVRLKRQLNFIRRNYADLIKTLQNEYGISKEESAQIVEQIEIDAENYPD
jgi:uncharacterized protein involved in exopolysaccharide biosynthesis